MEIKNKGKEKGYRPLYLRAFAVFMAVAMILSVIYVSHRRDRVHADEGSPVVLDPAVSDTSYLTGIAKFGTHETTTKNYVVNVPASGIVFTLPKVDPDSDTSKSMGAWVVKYTGTDSSEVTEYYPKSTEQEDIKSTLVSAGVDEDSISFAETSLHIIKHFIPVWYVGSESGVNTITSTAGTTTATCKVTVETHYNEGINEVTSQLKNVDASTTYVDVATISIKTYAISELGESGSNKDKNLAFTDADTSTTAGEYYYGTIAYSLAAGEHSPKPCDTFNELNDSFQIPSFAADGEYTATKTVTIPCKEGAIATKTKKLTRNFYVVTSIQAAGTEGEIAKTYDPDTSNVITIPASGKYNPKNAITVTVKTDAPADITAGSTDKTLSVTSKGAELDSVSGKTLYKYEVAIPGSAADNNGTTPSYTITVKETADNDIKDTYTVNVTYGNGQPTFKDPKINDAAASEAVVKTNTAKLGITTSVDTESGAKITKAELYKVSSSTADVSGDPAKSSTFNPTVVSGDATFSDVALTLGENFFKVKAYSDYDLAGVSDAFSVFYDNKAPVADKVVVGQTNTSYGGTASLSEAVFTVPNPITCKENATVTIDVSDKQSNNSAGSGVSLVTINGETCIVTDGKATYTITADNNKTAGGDLSLPVVIKDYAGNETSYTVNLKYLNETMTITSEVLPAKVSDDNSFFKWDNPASPAIKVNYTVETYAELDLTKTTVTAGGSSSSLTLTKSSEVGEDGKLTYTGTYNYVPTANAMNFQIVMSAENVNGVTGSDTTEVRHIDITDPGASVSVDSSSVSGENGWFYNLVLLVTVDDGTISSGIASITGSNTDQSSYTLTGNYFIAVVNQSDDPTGTPVELVVTDKAGNSFKHEETYKVDNTAPEITLTVNGISYDQITNPFSSDPHISYATSDTISGVDSYSVTVTDGSKTVTVNDTSLSGKSLGTILEKELDDATNYTVSISLKDTAGKTSYASTTFRVDTNPPVVTADIISPASSVKSAYPKVFNQNVTVRFTAKDVNLSGPGDITVVDSIGHSVNPTWNQQGDGTWVGDATLSTEGIYNIKVTAKDGAQNPESKSVSFTIDKTAPVLTTMINGAAVTGNAGYFGAAVNTSVGVSDANEDTLDVSAVISRTDFAGAVTTETFTGKGPFVLDKEGVYSITYSATDKAGNPASATVSCIVDLSNPKPVVNINTKYPKMKGFYNQASVDMTLEVNDPSVLASDIVVKDNDKVVQVNWTAAGGKLTAPYSVSSEEKHTIEISVKDLAGNAASTSETFEIDRTKPKVTTKVNSVEYNEKDDYYSSNTTSSIAVSDKNDDPSDVTLVVHFYGSDGSESTETKKGKGPFKFSKQGKYVLDYKAVDKAGNERTKTIGFYIDKGKPVGNMYIKTEKPAKFKKYHASYSNKVGRFKARKNQEAYSYGQYYNKNVTIEFNYYDTNIDSITITDGSEELIPEWTEKNGYGKGTVTVSSQGHHVIKMTLEDRAGNKTKYTSGSKILNFYIDKTAPSIVTNVNGSSSSEGSTVSMNSSGTVGVSVVDTYKDPDDLTRVATIKSPGGGTNVETAKVKEGSESFANEADYSIEYTAIDKAGNKSQPKSVAFRVDKTAPELSISSTAKNGASTDAVDVTFSIKEPFFNDMTSSKIEVYKKVDGAREAHVKSIDFMPRSGNDSKTDSYEEDGEYRFVFTASDKAGNDASESHTFILDGSKPVITLSGVKNYDKTEKNVELGIQVDETFYLTNKVTLEGTRTDIDGKKNDIKFDDFPSSSAKIAVLKEMFKEDGIYDITVTSVDKAGNSDTKTLHFTIDTEPPIIDSLEEYDGKKVNAFTFDKPLDDLVKDLTVCEIKLYMDGVEYDGSTSLPDGTHVFKIEATDEMGHTSIKEVTFVLDTMGPNIIVTGAEDKANLKDATQVGVSVELDGDFLDYVTVNGEAVAVSDNKCEINVNKRGKYNLKAAASDEAGNKTEIDINFRYGSGWLWLLFVGGGVILLAIILLLLLKRRKTDE